MAQWLARSGWIARSPAKTRVLTALKLAKRESLTDPDDVPPLLAAIGDGDQVIDRAAHEALLHLMEPGMIDELCRACIETGDPIAVKIVTETGYAPRDAQQRALLFFLTEQWERYESLDFDQGLLRAAYQTSPEALRHRVANKARQAGRADWIQSVVVGGRQGLRLGEMTDQEWETVAAVLGGRKRWA